MNAPPLARWPVVPLLAGGYTAGVVGGAILGGPAAITALLGVICVLAAALLGVSRTGLVVLVLSAALAVAGHQRIADLDAEPPPALATLRGEREVVGVARSDAVVRGSLQRVDLDVETVDGDGYEGGLRLTARADHGLLRAGDRVRVVADIDAPPPVEAFDYAAYLRDRDIYLVAAFPDDLDRLGAVDRGWRGRLQDLHRRVAERIGRTLPEPSASLAAGVLIGERGRMPAEVDEALRVTGTTHLVVVSGQNVALLVGMAVAVLTAVVSRRAASVVALAMLPAYVIFVGADPPVVRAAIMAVAVVAAGVTGRRTPGWVYLVYAAAVMLAAEPRLIRDVAFQLSAAATAGITTLSPALRDAILARLPRLSTPAGTSVVAVGATATGAALAVLPVQVAAFEVIAPWTVLANVLVAPLYEGVVFVAALAAVLGNGGLAGQVLALPPRAFLGLVKVLAALPLAQVPVRLPLVAGITFTGVLAALTAWLASWARSRPGATVLDAGVSTRFATTVGLGVVAVGLWWTALAPAEAHASVTVLDVGQGHAVLVRDGGATLLVDAGPPDGAVLAALGAAGVTDRLDAVVLTHHDLDHTGGLEVLRERFEVGALYVEASTTALAPGALPLDIGDRIRLGRVTVEVLAPPVATRDERLASDNDGSLVLMVSVGDRRILVTGDIEAPAEGWLVESGLDVRADALVVPHHGSASSSTEAFLRRVAPAVAVVPVGPNPYGHPHEEVIDRLESSTEAVYRTDEHGSVTFRSDGDRLWISTAR